MILLFGLGVSATVGIYAMLPLYLVTERHVEASWANTIAALSRSHGPYLGLLGGWASDRLGPNGPCGQLDRLPVRHDIAAGSWSPTLGSVLW